MPSTASKNCSILKFATKSKIASTSLSPQYKSPNSTVGSEIGAENLEISVNKSRDGVAKLVESFTSTIEEKWAKMLSAELRADRFAKLAIKILSNIENHAIYPPLPLIFSFTKFCSPEKLKVVILGQDPYHGINQANGLAFSVQHGIRTPPSLLNIYKELSSDIEGFTVPNHGCLESWARQGVLLLNATLTVVHGQPNSHSNLGWENFTDSIIRHISEINSNLVFLLWGKNAQQKRTIINRSQDHLILESFHPSPLSANRGFFGSKPFSKANMFLEEKGMVPVDWKSVCNKDS